MFFVMNSFLKHYEKETWFLISYCLLDTIKYTNIIFFPPPCIQITNHLKPRLSQIPPLDAIIIT